MKSPLPMIAFLTFVAIALGIAPGDPDSKSIDGNGFTAARYSAGKGGHFVTIADLNGDGNLDIAVANKDSDDVTILLGDGRGHFRSAPGNRGGGLVTATPKGRLPTVTSGPFGDLNGDGKADIVTANSGDNDI